MSPDNLLPMSPGKGATYDPGLYRVEVHEYLPPAPARSTALATSTSSTSPTLHSHISRNDDVVSAQEV